MVDILFGSGIDSMGCTLDAALDLGIVERRGSWYAYKGKNVSQGRSNLVELMKQDADLASALVEDVRLALSELGKGTVSVIANDFDTSDLAEFDGESGNMVPLEADGIVPLEADMTFE